MGEGGEFLCHENICFAGQQDLNDDLEPPPASLFSSPSPQMELPMNLLKAVSPAHLHTEGPFPWVPLLLSTCVLTSGALTHSHDPTTQGS